MYCFCLHHNFNTFTQKWERWIYYAHPTQFNHNHHHNYAIQVEGNPYQAKDRVKSDKSLQCLIALPVHTDLSINMAASKESNTILNLLANTIGATKSLRTYSHETIRDGIITFAEVLAPSVVLIIQRLQYYSISIDVASHGNRKGFFAMISNPSLKEKHHYVDTWLADGWKLGREIQRWSEQSSVMGEQLR
ncbi:hypothetical protein TVAG_223210 [Trichomonas vaginalis G3]|uniref:Uncharacterized protein n=1 Tax=Trichomonas vaginalis (strain ATCC PRA-98 / G3) TaxID=412133 RepID=A2FZ14_TRIV3|nr:hypothetical protein TVAGG3_0134490 [Trichomonas vaginalis G3]EAX89854.1 hypothetical protein TVAG_223210 [Trichomonas vaginalis G3]KAI5546305.1 hypothetical protein TVAGG3_0134490 [Trichomonas vaginalis G3]|eukprot:XP_001302784.1 hypothetical protein [Trichomonas vaginalis G3]